MFPPGVPSPMLRSASNAANKMTDMVKIEFALHLPVDHLPDKGGLAPLLSGGAAPERVALFSWKPNCESSPHNQSYSA